MLLVGEQEGKVYFQTLMGQAKPFTGILPSPRNGVRGSFPDEGTPSAMSGFEGRGKILLIRFTEHLNELLRSNAVQLEGCL